MDSLSFELFYTKGLLLLSRRPRSEKEIREKLLKKKADPDVVNGVIELLKKQKFLDDNQFALWWIRQRTDFKPRSKSFIKRELLQKGVSKEIIDESFEDESENINELAMAKKIVQKKIVRYASEDKKIVYQKLGQHLARRGFSWDIIHRAIDDYFK